MNHARDQIDIKNYQLDFFQTSTCFNKCDTQDPIPKSNGHQLVSVSLLLKQYFDMSAEKHDSLK